MIQVIAKAAPGKTLTLPDVLGDVILKIGGNPQRTHSACQLDQVHKSYGAQYGANVYDLGADGATLTYVNGVPRGPQAGNYTGFYLPVFLREPWRDSYAARDMYCWPTTWADGSVLSSFQMSLAIPAASQNVNSTVAPTINVYAEMDSVVGSLDPTTKTPVQLITKWKRQPFVYNGAGQLVVTALTKREIYNQISLFSAYINPAPGRLYVGPMPGNTPAQIILDQNDPTAFDPVTYCKVEVDNRTVRDVKRLISDQMLVDNNFSEGALPLDRLDVVFDESDVPTDGLVMQANGQSVLDFRLTLTLASAQAQNMSVAALMQIYGGIEQ